MQAKFKTAIDHELTKSNADIAGTVMPGISISHLIDTLRDKGWRGVTEYNIEQAGYRIVKGKVGKWTKGGFQLVQPARVVIAK